MNDLIPRLKAGEPKAYEFLVDEYGDRVRRFASRLAGPEAAEDVVQEVFLRIYRSIGSFDPSGSFAAWIFTIANNLCVDRIRKRPPVPPPPRSGPDPSESAEIRETRQAVLRAVQDLPEEQKRVFLLREEAGLSFREISELMSCPLGTALFRMHAALASLRKALKVPMEKSR